jgi:hypothetical protein
VGWEELLLDFGASPYLYLAVFKLPLEDLASLGITLDVLCQWDAKRVYRKHGLDPAHGPMAPDLPYSDAIVANLGRALDRDLFLLCKHYEPTDWNLYMNMTYRDLRRLGIKAEDLMRLWPESYSTLEDILVDFGWDKKHTRGALPRGFAYASNSAKRDARLPVHKEGSVLGAAPGSLRQMRAQRGGDNLFEEVKWDVDTDLLEPVSSGDTTSSEEDAAPKSRATRRSQAKPTPNKQTQQTRQPRRRRKKEEDYRSEESGGGFGDIFPALANLLAGPPASPPARDRKRRNPNQAASKQSESGERRGNTDRRRKKKKSTFDDYVPAIDD